MGISAGWIKWDKARLDAMLASALRSACPEQPNKSRLDRNVTVKMDEVLYNYLSMIAQGKGLTLAAFIRQLGRDRVRNKKTINEKLAR